MHIPLTSAIGFLWNKLRGRPTVQADRSALAAGGSQAISAPVATSGGVVAADQATVITGPSGGPTIVVQSGGTLIFGSYLGGLPEAKDLALRAAFEEGQRLQDEGYEAQNAHKHQEAIDRFTRALALAENDSQRAALRILRGNSYGSISDYDRAEADYEETLKLADRISPTKDAAQARASALGNLGLVYADRGELDKAEEHHKGALEINREIGDRLGEAAALGNLGLVYGRRGDPENLDRAEQYGKQALEMHREIGDRLGEAASLGNLGIVYGDKKDLDEAIKCFEKSLAEKSHSLRGHVWNGLGLAYAEKGNTDKAIECYEKGLAEKSPDSPGHLWYNMGNVRYSLGMYDQALRSFLNAEDAYNSAGMREDQRDAHLRVELVSGLLNARRGDRAIQAKEKSALADLVISTSSGAISPAEGARPECPVRRDPKDDIARIVNEFGDRSEDYYAKTESSKTPYVMAVLKGWSSATPVLSSVDAVSYPAGTCRGGGYFIKAKDSGVVLDPGYDFLHNFGTGGFHVREIGDVIVTHNHPDHRDDLTRVADLAFQYRRRAQAGQLVKPIKYWLDPNSNESLKTALRGCSVDDIDIDQLQSSNQSILLNCGVGCTPFETEHKKTGLTRPHGCVLAVTTDTRTTKVGYTSDTAYSATVRDAVKDCGVILAHFSAASLDDFAGKERHANHLGFSGMMELIRGTKAQLYILSEFWGGMGDIRFELAQKIKYDLFREGRKDLHVMPGDIGLVIDLSNLTLRCTQCGSFVDYDRIRTIKPDVPFGQLRYMCDQCIT